MKKLIPGLLVLALFLSACGGPAAEETPTPAPEPTPAQTAEPTPTPEPTPVYSGVHTDWSKLEPYQPVQAVYTRRYEGFTDTLIRAEDYGPLIPFAGTKLTVGEELAGMYDEGFELYGLVTLEGEVVMDPVLTSVSPLEAYDNAHCVGPQTKAMLLGKTVYDGEGHPEGRYALCAVDGRWCTDFLYQYDWEWERGSDLILRQGIPVTNEKGNIVFLDLNTGKELRTLDLAGQAGSNHFSIMHFAADPKTGWVSVQIYFRGENGENNWVNMAFDPRGGVHLLPQEIRDLYQYGDGLIPAMVVKDLGNTANYCYGYVDAETGEWVIAPELIDAGVFVNGAAPVWDESGIYFINTAGERLTESYHLTGNNTLPAYYEGHWYVLEDYEKIKAVLDEKLNPVESPLQGVREHSFLPSGWIHGETQTDSILVRGDEIHSFTHGRGYLTNATEDRAFFVKNSWQENGATVTITDLEGNEVAQIAGYSYGTVDTDTITGEGFIYAYSRNKTDLYDTDGILLATDVGNGDVRGGMVYVPGEEWTTLTDKEGNVIFCWPIYPADD